jgi:hypothetical protein
MKSNHLFSLALCDGQELRVLHTYYDLTYEKIMEDCKL